MLDKELIAESRKLREQVKSNKKSFSIWKLGNTLQINFDSPGCINRKAGQCYMCEYGHGRMVDTDDINEAIQIIKEDGRHKEIVFGTCGSIFNELEFSKRNFEYLISRLKEGIDKDIIFEVHYKDVNDEVLSYIQRELKNKHVMIEMGFETSSNEIREKCLGKVIDNAEMVKIINKIHDYNFGVTLNILFGIPWLSKNERLRDCLSSIGWAEKNGVDTVVLFPLNIKENTLIEKWYNEGKYERVSHYEFIGLLDKIDINYLSHISLSWFGDRQYSGIKYSGISPYCEDKDLEIILGFYNKFLVTNDKYKLKEMIRDTIDKLGINKGNGYKAVSGVG